MGVRWAWGNVSKWHKTLPTNSSFYNNIIQVSTKQQNNIAWSLQLVSYKIYYGTKVIIIFYLPQCK